MRPVEKQVLGGIAIIVLVFFALWQVPKWQVEYSGVKEAEKRFTLEDKARGTLAQIFGGLFILVGLYLTYRRITATERNVEIAQRTLEASQEGQVTERFTRAIGQLGDKENLEVRLGGIYALERIARDSPKDHWTIMEVLTAFVREKARWEDKPGRDEGKEIRPPADIQAILTVLGRRERTIEQENQSLDLNTVDIRGADLAGTHLEKAYLERAHLEQADLAGAHLERASLAGAHLWGAILAGAHLEGADLAGAYLEQASLERAHLEAASLERAHLERAFLVGANLEVANLDRADLWGANLARAHLDRASLAGAHLERANLTNATGLTQKQVESAITAEDTALPDYLKETG